MRSDIYYAVRVPFSNYQWHPGTKTWRADCLLLPPYSPARYFDTHKKAKAEAQKIAIETKKPCTLTRFHKKKGLARKDVYVYSPQCQRVGVSKIARDVSQIAQPYRPN
jgi:hypothetical protein